MHDPQLIHWTFSVRPAGVEIPGQKRTPVGFFLSSCLSHSRDEMSRLTLIISLLVLLVAFASAMKREDFKTCAQSGFCRRNRAYADHMVTSSSPYRLLQDSVQWVENNSHVRADIKNLDTDVLLVLDLYVLQDNTVRIRINEKNLIKPRYDDHAKYTLHQDPPVQANVKQTSIDDKSGLVTVVLDDTRTVTLSPDPLRIDFLVDGAPVVSLNDRGFLNFEHLRTKETHKPKMIQQTNEDGTLQDVEAPWETGLWEETFKTWTDPKPNGNYSNRYPALLWIKFWLTRNRSWKRCIGYYVPRLCSRLWYSCKQQTNAKMSKGGLTVQHTRNTHLACPLKKHGKRRDGFFERVCASCSLKEVAATMPTRNLTVFTTPMYSSTPWTAQLLCTAPFRSW